MRRETYQRGISGIKWGIWNCQKKCFQDVYKRQELAGSGIAVTSQNARAFIQYISDMENMNYYLIPEKKSIGRFG